LAQEGTASQEAKHQLTVIEERTGRGEQCLVCGQRIYDSAIIELRYKGRRFHLAASMLEDFEQSPDIYFRQLQAHSGLFDETAITTPGLSKGWLYLGCYVVLGLISAALCGYIAIGRGLAPIPWFFAGLAGNVAALGLLHLAPRGDASGVPKGFAKASRTPLPLPSPACGSANHPAAAAWPAGGALRHPPSHPATQGL
jgi:hypothetical protein